MTPHLTVSIREDTLAVAYTCTTCDAPIKRPTYRKGESNPKLVHVTNPGGDRHKVRVAEEGVGFLRCLVCRAPARDHDPSRRCGG